MGNKYSRLQISIHWLVFLLVIVAYCAMEFRGFFPRSDRPLINMIHVSCGISILVLMVVRLLLRLKCPTPPIIPKPKPIDAPRDKCTLSCAINGIHAAFHYLKKNYISGCVMTVPTG